MISLKYVKRYCRDYVKIENYDIAVADTTQKWECHHRLEIMPFYNHYTSAGRLKELGMYYDVQPEALIFLSSKDHRKLHNRNPERSRKISKSNKGKIRSNETKKKIGIASAKKPKELFIKASIAGRSPIANKKRSETLKRAFKDHPHHWWNNGVKETFQEYCPEGFSKGRLPGVLRKR